MAKDPRYELMREMVTDYLQDYWDDRFHLLGLSIQGAEVTQSIQHYRADQHLTDAADRGPDNSIRLVARKPTWVRVYLRSGLADSIADVTGTAVLERRVFGFLWNEVATLTPEPPGTVTALKNPDYTNERSNTAHTLNFVIPADLMVGHLRIRVEVSTPAPHAHTAEHTEYINATLQQTINVAGIMVGYNGPPAGGGANITLAAPAVADLEATAAWMLDAYPISEATFRSAGTVTLLNPLTDAPSCQGCCSPNWVSLNTDIAAVRTADGNQPGDVYYGLLAVGIPMGPIIGCASGGVSSGSDGNQVTMAHEIGHVMGFNHAPCGGVGASADPAYPTYEPYASASIGEFGLNVNTGDVYPPATFVDYMSYCNPDWISLYHYKRLVNHDLLHPEIVGEDSPWWHDWKRIDPFLFPHEYIPDPPPEGPELPAGPDGPDPIPWKRMRMRPEKLISIIGVVRDHDVLEVTHVSRVEAFRQLRDARPTDMVAELLGDDGERLARAPVQRLPHYSMGACPGCPDEDEPDTYLVQVMMQDVADGAALRIVRDREELWSRKAPSARPEVTDVKVSVDRRGRLVAECKVKHATRAKPELWIRWSDDDGKSWHPLRTGLTGKRHVLDLAGVPQGRVQIQVLAHDGFHTAASKPARLTVPKRAHVVTILQPQRGQALVEGRRMRLLGRVGEPSGHAVKLTRCEWKLDGRVVAKTLDAAIEAPAAGKHELSLSATVGRTRVERKVTFETMSIRQRG